MNQPQRIAELHHQIGRRRPGWDFGQIDRVATWLTGNGQYPLTPQVEWVHPDAGIAETIARWRTRIGGEVSEAASTEPGRRLRLVSPAGDQSSTGSDLPRRRNPHEDPLAVHRSGNAPWKNTGVIRGRATS